MNEILRMYDRPDCIQVAYYGKPIGSVRQNRRSRHRQDRLGERIETYNSYKAILRDAMAIVMEQQGIEKLPKADLWIKADFFFHTEEEKRSVDPDNLLKGVLDSCNGILIPDDKWVDITIASRHVGKELVMFKIGVI